MQLLIVAAVLGVTAAVIYLWFRVNLYLVRVPIFSWAVPLILSLLLLTSAGAGMLKNLFIISGAWNIFGVAFFAAVLSHAAYVTAETTALYARRRFGSRNAITRGMTSGVGAFLSIPFWAVVVATGLTTSSASVPLGWSWVPLWFAGLIALLCATYLAEELGNLLQRLTAAPLTALVRWVRNCGKQRWRRICRVFIPDWMVASKRGVTDWFPGYLEVKQRQVRIRVRHLSNTVLSLITLAVYLPYAYDVEASLNSGAAVETFGTPALLFALAGIGFLCYITTGAAFLLDRYRVPLGAALLIAALLIARFADTDHYFAARQAPEQPLASAEQMLALGDKAILIAAEGGGIQAAGWATKVLAGLSELDGFKDSVRLVSGVSGGAVGALYYLRTYPASGPEPLSLEEAYRMSVAPNLEPVGWGLIHIDLRNTLFPFGRDPLMDRGWALERSMSKRARSGGLHLSEWAANTGANLPAAMFGATEVETGLPLVMSTTAFGDGKPSVRSFLENDDLDTEVATAARLSAAFPLVSPAARPLICINDQSGEQCRQPDRPGAHLTDGGFYDNAGVYALLAWLDTARQMPRRPRILIIRTESFPSAAAAADPPKRSWMYQFLAPLDALAGIRTSAQRGRNDDQLDLQNRLQPFEQAVCAFEAPPPCERPSLSWNLSPNEIACLDRAWERIVQEGSGCRDKVAEFLAAP